MTGPRLLGDRYELRGVLGFGGMAEVRDGWDARLNRPVAVKLLHPGLASAPDIRERFKIEARAAAALNHPNIVAVYDFGDEDGTSYIVMERLPGDTLGDQIAQGPLPQAQVYAALNDVLSALSAAHEAGMLHRDIKPGNILLTPVSVKVADFGIAKTPGAAHTTTGQIVGTLAYLSPERLAGEPASVADDLYAAAVVGYEALTGRKPFPQEDIAPLARAIIEQQPPPLTTLRPEVEPSLAAVIERAMSREPIRRYPSAEAMRADLVGGGWRMAASTVPVSPVNRPPTMMLDATPADVADSTAAPRRARGPARRVFGAAAVLTAIAVAIMAFAFDSTTTQPRAPEPISISTSVPAPINPAPPPPPVVQPPSPTAVVEQATAVVPPNDGNGKGNGNGRGRGNGNGNKKGPKS